MSARRRLGPPIAVAAVALATPTAVAAHAIGGTYQLPVPLTLYLGAAAVAVLASFVVAAIALGPAGAAARYPAASIPDGVMRAASVLLSLLGLAWWGWTLWTAFVVGDITTVPAVLFWIVLWVGLPILAVLIGNGWRSFSPFRTLYRLLDRAALATGMGRLALNVPYPPGLARWPGRIGACNTGSCDSTRALCRSATRMRAISLLMTVVMAKWLTA